jgi:phage tail-like protein
MPWLRRDVDVDADQWLKVERSAAIRDCDFVLEVEGMMVGVFYSCSGGDIAVAKITHDITYESGSSTTLFFPGTTSFGEISLSQGWGNYMQLYNWLMQASEGHIIAARRNASIIMLKKKEPKVRWDLENAWPIKLAGFSVTTVAGTTTAITKLNVTIVAETISYVEI